jgi:hypothetical protein
MDPPTSAITSEYDESQLKWLRSKKVCDECQSIFDHWYARDNWDSERPDHSHHTPGGLQESARDGCPVCEIFLNSFWDEGLSDAPLQDYPGRAQIEVEANEMGEKIFEIRLVYLGEARSSRLCSLIHFVAAGE